MTALMHVASSASASLLAAIWQSLVLTLCVWLSLRLLPRISTAWRSRLWLVVFLLAAALPLLQRDPHGGVQAPPSGLHADVRWALALLCTWAIFAGWSTYRLLRGALELRRVVLGAHRIQTPAALQDLLADVHPVALYISSEVEVPSVAGFFHPRILLPAGLLERISIEDLRQIVLHELEHLRRRDNWTNLLQKLVLALCPLNPVLMWLERRLCVERELACDDGVLQATGAGEAYATCLTNLAEQTMLRRGLALALGAWRRQSELARRVHRILQGPQACTGWKGAAALGGLVPACAVAALVLARTPLTISFDGGAVSTAAAVTAEQGSELRATGAAHATLVKAVMPVGAQPVVRKRIRHQVMIAPHRELVRRPEMPASQVVLIGWSQGRVTATPAVYFAPAAGTSSVFTYAAVPVRNGWLIVQL